MVAGVSRTTVSYALSDGACRDLIRADVCKAAELGYYPNRHARSLVTGRTRTMALMVQSLSGSNIWRS